MSEPEIKADDATHQLTLEASHLGCVLQSLSERLPTCHPSRVLLEGIAEALSDALETQ